MARDVGADRFVQRALGFDPTGHMLLDNGRIVTIPDFAPAAAAIVIAGIETGDVSVVVGEKAAVLQTARGSRILCQVQRIRSR